jgi:hypothetical protein
MSKLSDGRKKKLATEGVCGSTCKSSMSALFYFIFLLTTQQHTTTHHTPTHHTPTHHTTTCGATRAWEIPSFTKRCSPLRCRAVQTQKRAWPRLLTGTVRSHTVILVLLEWTRNHLGRLGCPSWLGCLGCLVLAWLLSWIGCLGLVVSPGLVIITRVAFLLASLCCYTPTRNCSVRSVG